MTIKQLHRHFIRLRKIIVISHALNNSKMSASIEDSILQTLESKTVVEDTYLLAQELQKDHNEVVGVMKSLQAHELILVEDIDHFQYILTDEAKSYLKTGSPEAQLMEAIPKEGISLTQLKVRILLRFLTLFQSSVESSVSDIGFKQAMALKWVEVKKENSSTFVFRKVRSWSSHFNRIEV